MCLRRIKLPPCLRVAVEWITKPYKNQGDPQSRPDFLFHGTFGAAGRQDARFIYMKTHVLLSVILMLLLCACQATPLPAKPAEEPPSPASKATVTPIDAATATSAPVPSLPAPTETPVPFVTPTAALTDPAPVVHLVKQGPDKVTCPILLYHVIADYQTANPYVVSPQEFRDQMQALKDWGYTSISASQLVEALNLGAMLPERPIVITFDDGDESVYTQAYPIMREFGFVGVNYLVVNYVGAPNHMTVDQLKKLAAAGWEAGSHSITHADLTKSNNTEWEVVQSRLQLEKLLGAKVETIAYPYGKMIPNMLKTVAQNYRAGMGLGSSVVQNKWDLYYLWRRPVNPGWSIQTFGSFLPWSAPPGN